MKKYFIILLFLGVCQLIFAQQHYKYVIVPTQFPDFAEGFNPHGLSTSLQNEFTTKSIENIFRSEDAPDDYCDALTVSLVKLKSTLRNKLKVELKDCRNRVIWSQEGTGRSKEFRKGFGEAIADALKSLDELPINQNAAPAKKTVATKPTENESDPLPAIVEEPQPKSGIEISNKNVAQETIYNPENLFYNYTYFLDLVEKDNGQMELVVLNGELLGYQNLQAIATLVPTGLDGVFTVLWINTDGGNVQGVANLTSSELKLSLPDGDKMQVVQLQKY